MKEEDEDSLRVTKRTKGVTSSGSLSTSAGPRGRKKIGETGAVAQTSPKKHTNGTVLFVLPRLSLIWFLERVKNATSQINETKQMMAENIDV